MTGHLHIKNTRPVNQSFDTLYIRKQLEGISQRTVTELFNRVDMCDHKINEIASRPQLFVTEYL